ncbi:hypothetical protein B0H67DRAFT_586544 [Lasiosphaeris hirsuta]|uniref:DUF8212 domain-containing protein n=1 Tax=Lasiosphaeris hirsuta TaxID=260670 RepID=A0AA40DQL2_9PEZI|nr:hypothetical protein B0H67DRAFT_586544 [Lasiosphaeris hirsuta]
MRLINLKTLKLDEFQGHDVPEYAILSHMWTDEEISYQDYVWMDEFRDDVADGLVDEMPRKTRKKLQARYAALTRKAGYIKIQRFIECCRTGQDHERKQGKPPTFSHAWVDTCCINRESSAEVAEAVTAAWAYYADTAACIAFLGDVGGSEMPNAEFYRSRWFTRGWTLAELLAPHDVALVNRDWDEITARSLSARVIAKATGIDPEYLAKTHDRAPPRQAPVATKMMWASTRKTTRLEDEAYSLLGLFDVSMPVLYGEGAHAFERLQEEILRTSPDQSLLAWGYGAMLDARQGVGLLAASPGDFEYCDAVKPLRVPRNLRLLFDDVPFRLTNAGLEITTVLFKLFLGSVGRTRTYALLPAAVSGFVLGLPVGGPDVDEKPLLGIHDGAVLSRAFAEHPVTPLFHAEGGSPWPETIARRRVLIRASAPARNDGAAAGRAPLHVTRPERPPFWVLNLQLQRCVQLRETWSPSLVVQDVRREVPSGRLVLRFKGSVAHEDPAGPGPTHVYLRVYKHQFGGDFHAEVVIVVSVDLRMGNVFAVGTYEWDRVRRLEQSWAPSLTALFYTAPAMQDVSRWPSQFDECVIETKAGVETARDRDPDVVQVFRVDVSHPGRCKQVHHSGRCSNGR